MNTYGEFNVGVLPLKGLAPPLDSFAPDIVSYDGTVAKSSSYSSGVGPRNDLNAYLQHLGLPANPVGATGNDVTLDVSKIVNMPNHAVASAAEVAARGLHVRGLPYEAMARDFKSMTYQSTGTDSIDVSFPIASSTLTFYAQQLGVDVSTWKVGGHESIVIGGTGFLASTNVATLEFIYHVEATPNPAYSLLARPTGALHLVAPSATLDQVLTTLHRIPRISFSDVITQVGDAMLGDIEGRAAGAAAKGLGGIAGQLARLVMAST